MGKEKERIHKGLAQTKILTNFGTSKRILSVTHYPCRQNPRKRIETEKNLEGNFSLPKMIG